MEIMDDPSSIAGMNKLLNRKSLDPSIKLDDVEKQIITEQDFGDMFKKQDDEPSSLLKNYTDTINSISHDKFLADDGLIEFSEPLKDDQSVLMPDTASQQTDFEELMRKAQQNTETPVTEPINFSDQRLSQITEEQKRRDITNSVFDDMDTININVDDNINEDRKYELLARIEAIRDDLESAGENVSNIPIVTIDSNPEIIERSYQRLNLKLHRNGLNSLAQEMIMLGLNFLEIAFDGKKSYFGVKPDLVGFPELGRRKLRRHGYEMAEMGSTFVETYNVSPGWMIGMEIAFAALTYSRRKRKQHGDSIFDESRFDAAVEDIENAI